MIETAQETINRVNEGRVRGTKGSTALPVLPPVAKVELVEELPIYDSVVALTPLADPVGKGPDVSFRWGEG